MQRFFFSLCICVALCSYTMLGVTRYVTPTGAGAMDGTSWANAFPGTSLQAAITASSAGDEVWVAFGTYNPPLGEVDVRNNAFSMKNGVTIYGGFQGMETAVGQRRVVCGQASILSGEIGAVGNTDNCYHVIRNGNLNATAVLDGFVIRDANNNRTISTGESGNGGGIYNGGSGVGNNSSPTIRNCIITQNTARYGGGIFNNGFNGGTVNATISHCIIAFNTALEGGGGIDFFTADGGNAAPLLTNTLVCNNTAQNITGGQGAGGMYLWGGTCTPSIINSVFANNASAGIGGGIIIDNTPLFGGVSGTCNVIVQNSIFQGNTAVTNGPQFSIRAGGTFTATYSFVDMTPAGQAPFPISGAGTGNITTGLPGFVNAASPMGADACWLTADDGLQIQAASVCVNAGDNTGVAATDIWGVNRILATTVDIGAYEYRALTLPSFAPTSALAGANVVLTGTGFIGTSAVSFGGTAATSFTVDSDTQITAVVGAGGASGNVQVTASGSVNLAGFTFLVPPTITSFAPTSAGAGATVVITGTSFTGATIVRFGGTAATSFTVDSPTQITAVVGSGTSGAVEVVAPGGTALLAGFTFTTPAPPVVVTPPVVTPPTPTPPTAFQPTAPITLQTSLGVPYGLTLTANGSPAPVFSFIGGNLPPGIMLDGNGRLSGTPSQEGRFVFTVEARNSAGALQAVITIVVGMPRPVITAVSGEQGSIGATVILTGYNLNAVQSVSFGGIPALRFTIDSPNQITAVVGAGNSGVIQVISLDGTASAPQTFRYIPPAQPVITSVQPSMTLSGDDDYSIVLRGSNFSPFASYIVSPETNTNASFSVPLPAVLEFVNSTEARLRLPLASRTLGMKRLTVRIGDVFASATFAVLAGAKPEILSQTVPSTTASSAAFTTELVGRNFFRRGFATIRVNGELANASVFDSTRARVEIPSRMNILGAKIVIRLTNYDGQFAETTLNVVSRIAPYITSVQSRLTQSGRTRMRVLGSGFWGAPHVLVQNRNVTLVGITPAELDIELPHDFPRPGLTEEPWVLTVENPDTQKYGFRIASHLFYPRNSSFAGLNSEAGTETGTDIIVLSPNPATDEVILKFASTEERIQAFDKHGSIIQSALNAASSPHPIQVFDIYGNTVVSTSALTTESLLRLDVHNLASGMYFVRVDGVRGMGRFVVMR